MIRSVGFLLIGLCVAGCVDTATVPDSERADGVLAGTPIEVGDMTLVAEQMTDWPQMAPMVTGDRGESEIVQIGTADTVIISGAPDFDTAVNALGQFCGRKIDPMGFDTQFVYKEPSSGNYWFDGFCG